MRERLFLLGMLALACGGRAKGWDEEFRAGDVVGLQTAVAVMDPSLDRVILLESPSALALEASYLPVGKSVATAVASPKRDRLFVLSKGVQPRRKESDELPSLSVIDTQPSPRVTTRYELEDPFSGLSLDPEGEWALVHAGGGVLENPNELILIDLLAPNAEPHIKSIRSFGGSPSRFTFTSPLTVPNAEPRRLLVVQTEQDLTLIDLADLDAPEITVLTPDAGNGQLSRPALVAFHDGDPDDPDDAVLAVSFSNSTSVFLIRLAEGNQVHAFLPQIASIVEAGGVPSSLDFLTTDGGLRLAVLVPSLQQAALVDPKTATVDLVPMPAAFSGLARITDSVENSSGRGDYALLWQQSQRLLGIWRLDAVIGAPYNSVETFDISVGVGSVLDVPGPEEGACTDPSTCFAHYKIVESAGAGDFYLLDLNQQEASLMVTGGRPLDLSLSPDGERLWAYEAGGFDFASVGFSNLHPISLSAEVPIRGVFDVGRPSGSDSARSAIVVHEGDGLAATVLDALEPDGARTRFYSGLALGGLK